MKGNLSLKRDERKPLGQGIIHPSESLPRVERKPLGQGRIHPSESLPRV